MAGAEVGKLAARSSIAVAWRDEVGMAPPKSQPPTAAHLAGVVAGCCQEAEDGLLEEPQQLLARRRGIGWVVDGPQGVVWRLEADGELSGVPLRVNPEVSSPPESKLTPLLIPGAEPRLLLVDAEGEVRREVAGLWRDPALRPRSAALLPDGGIVVGYADLSERQGGGLLRWAGDGSCAVWLWRPGPMSLLEPAGLDATAAGSLIVADPQLHVVTEVEPGGRVSWRHGSPGRPGGGADHLRAPTDCRGGEEGVLITDSMNHRVLEVGWDGRPTWEVGAPAFHLPRAALRLPAGNILVADTGHRRVVQVTRSGHLVDVWGPRRPPRPSLCQPRSVELTPEGLWLVADTNNHRVVEIDARGALRHQYGDGQPGCGSRLHWPRCARLDASGRVVVADGVNGRIVWFDRRGALYREVTRVEGGADGLATSFMDPHDLRPFPHGGILCTDSQGAFVVELDAEGRVGWSFGLPGGPGSGELHDPHQAQRDVDGSTWIVDSLNHRLLRVGPGGRILQRIDSVSGPGGDRRLVYPRGMERHGRGWVVIDGGGSLLLLDDRFQLRHCIGPDLDGGSESVRWNAPPRFIKSLAPDRIAVSDYHRGRILLLAGCRID